MAEDKEAKKDEKKDEQQPPAITPEPSPKKVKISRLKTQIRQPITYTDWVDLMRRYDRGEIRNLEDRPASMREIAEAIGLPASEIVVRFKMLREAEAYKATQKPFDITDFGEEFGSMRRELEGLREDMAAIAAQLPRERKIGEGGEVTTPGYQTIEMPDGTKIHKPMRPAAEEIAITRSSVEKTAADKAIQIGGDVATKLVNLLDRAANRIDKFLGTLESIALAQSGRGPMPSTEAQAEDTLAKLERMKEE